MYSGRGHVPPKEAGRRSDHNAPFSHGCFVHAGPEREYASGAMPRVIHFEIPAENAQRAAEFYKSVFGWKIKDAGMPMPYFLATTGKEGTMGIDGAIMGKKGTTAQAVTNTIDVRSVDESVVRITGAGGKQVTQKDTIPGIGDFCYCTGRNHVAERLPDWRLSFTEPSIDRVRNGPALPGQFRRVLGISPPLGKGLRRLGKALARRLAAHRCGPATLSPPTTGRSEACAWATTSAAEGLPIRSPL